MGVICSHLSQDEWDLLREWEKRKIFKLWWNPQGQMTLETFIPSSPDFTTTSYSSQAPQALLCSSVCLENGRRTGGYKGERIFAPGFLLHSLNAGGGCAGTTSTPVGKQKEMEAEICYTTVSWASPPLQPSANSLGPPLFCFPLQIFSCFPNLSCQLRQPTIHS